MSDLQSNDPPITFHLVPEDIWAAAASSDSYVPEAYASDGFIHCTDGVEEMIAVGNRYYQFDPRRYVVLSIARERLLSPVIYEDPNRIFPHIYGPLNTNAVVTVSKVQRDGDGRFISFSIE